MGFERKIGDFDPSGFEGDPFEELESSKSVHGEDRFERLGEKIGNILGYAIIGIILGIALKILLGT